MFRKHLGGFRWVAGRVGEKPIKHKGPTVWSSNHLNSIPVDFCSWETIAEDHWVVFPDEVVLHRVHLWGLWVGFWLCKFWELFSGPCHFLLRSAINGLPARARRLVMIKKDMLKAACFLCWRFSSLTGRVCFEWVTKRSLCWLGEQWTVSPRCGLFAFGCLISARMPLSLQSGIAATKAGLSSDGVEWDT